ncbi:hypothetical protein [Marinomonas sp. 2405UD68-3]|uniref:hypothetical protein n=1 Tax=Marinomonas sp. 2405UD68-3 TaxID=3391835 RepID=UPI0039C9A866
MRNSVHKAELDLLDILILNHLKDKEAGYIKDLLSEGEKSERLVVTSWYVSLITDLKKNNPKVDVSSLYKSKFRKMFNESASCLLPRIMEVKVGYTVCDRLDMTIKNLPGVSSTARADFVRYIVGQKITVTQALSDNWVNSDTLSLVASMLMVREEWLLSGEGAASPLAHRGLGDKALVGLGDSMIGGQCHRVELSILLLPDADDDSESVLIMEKIHIKSNFGVALKIIPIARCSREEVNDYVKKAMIKIITPVVYEVKSESWMVYLLGDAPMTMVYKDAKVKAYAPGIF